MHLIDTNATRAFAYWVGMHLPPAIIASDVRLKTSGGDSGMNNGERHQLGFRADQFVVIGELLRPGRMLAFLNHEELPKAIRELIAARDAANKARQEAG